MDPTLFQPEAFTSVEDGTFQPCALTPLVANRWSPDPFLLIVGPLRIEAARPETLRIPVCGTGMLTIGGLEPVVIYARSSATGRVFFGPCSSPHFRAIGQPPLANDRSMASVFFNMNVIRVCDFVIEAAADAIMIRAESGSTRSNEIEVAVVVRELCRDSL